MSWTAYGKGKVGRRFERAGWTIEHCGHPTATWPWTAVSPDGETIVSWHGHGWRTVAEARDHIDEHIDSGTRVLSRRFDGPPRMVRKCYACDAPSSGRAIPGGNPATPDAPACDRHAWASLGCEHGESHADLGASIPVAEIIAEVRAATLGRTDRGAGR